MDQRLSQEMADIADIADEVGCYDEADAIAALLPKINIIRQAQYESGQNYWLLNQRAFERAWRIKREKAGLSQATPTTPDNFRSAQECWFEVLEEYQDALLGNDADMLSKYAATDNPSCPKCGNYNAMLEHWDEIKGEFSRKCRDCGYEAKKPDSESKKPDPATETADNGCTTTMSEGMTKFHKDLESGSEGMSAGEQISRKFGPRGFNAAAISREILNKISERLMEGSAPGVAFYEAMDHFTSGEYEKEVLASAMENVMKIASMTEKLAASEDEDVAAEIANLTRTLQGKISYLKAFLDTVEQRLDALPKPASQEELKTRTFLPGDAWHGSYSPKSIQPNGEAI